MDALLFLSGNDIPFPSAQVNIHQPTIKEIAFLGEDIFFTGVEYLKFSKDNLQEEDRINLEGYSDFDILMSMIMQKNLEIQRIKISIEMVLSLIFPEYNISFNLKYIQLTKNDESHYINSDNFVEFKQIIHKIFAIDEIAEKEQEYNPTGDLSKSIVEKLKKRRQKLMEIKNENPNQKVSIINRYISILSVGLQKDMNDYMNYTAYQLFDEFRRYELKVQYDLYIKAKLAGAKDLEEVEDWMKELHP